MYVFAVKRETEAVLALLSFLKPLDPAKRRCATHFVCGGEKADADWAVKVAVPVVIDPSVHG